MKTTAINRLNQLMNGERLKSPTSPKATEAASFRRDTAYEKKIFV